MFGHSLAVSALLLGVAFISAVCWQSARGVRLSLWGVSMLRAVKSFCVALLFVNGAAGQLKPMPPAKQVTFKTVVGKLERVGGHAEVSVEGRVTRKKHVQFIIIGFSQQGSYKIPAEDVELIANEIEKASEKLEAETLGAATLPSDAKIGSVSVGFKDWQQEIYVEIAWEIDFTSERIWLDAENAIGVAESLRKARGVALWLKGRTAALSPSHPGN